MAKRKKTKVGTYSDDFHTEIATDSKLLYYFDGGEDHVELYFDKGNKGYIELDDDILGFLEVWTDRSNEARIGSQQEYIIINDTIVYLDSLNKM